MFVLVYPIYHRKRRRQYPRVGAHKEPQCDKDFGVKPSRGVRRKGVSPAVTQIVYLAVAGLLEHRLGCCTVPSHPLPSQHSSYEVYSIPCSLTQALTMLPAAADLSDYLALS